MNKTQRKCVKKKCVCKFSLAKIARKNLPWAQLTGSQDIILMSSSKTQLQNEVTSNSLVLMSLGDKLGKKIIESKQIATTSNLPHGVLTLDISQEAIQALVRFASEGRVDLHIVSEQIREELLKFSIRFSVCLDYRKCVENFFLKTLLLPMPLEVTLLQCNTYAWTTKLL